jgi:myo-inositol-1(or 4)-monophosphatase
MDLSGLPVSSTGQDALAVARRCRDDAAAIMRAEFGRAKAQATKGRGNVVTAVDFAVEKRTMEILAEHFPEHAVLAEETGAEVRSDSWLWVVDPLDGTKNFATGIPYFCYTLALWHGPESPVLALTYEPLRGEEFLAVASEGMLLDGVPARASDCEDLGAAVLGVDMGYIDQRGKNMLGLAYDLWPGLQSLRICGSAALGMAYAACGRYDLFVHNNVYPWDIAAGILLTLEAGGAVTDRDGGPVTLFSEGIVCGGRAVHADFLARAAGVPWHE